MAIEDALQQIDQAVAAIRASLTPPGVVLGAGADLQAALDQGGPITLAAGATWEGTYRVHVPGTRLLGPLAAIHGSQGPALLVPPGSHDLAVTLGAATTAWDQAVVEVGENSDRQTRVEDAPAQIDLQIGIPRHRGKRGLSLHGRALTIHDCTIADIYDPAGRDSQAIWIGNSPGPVRVTDATLEAGSENVLVGGAPLAIPGCEPEDLLFDRVTLTKPLAWQTDGINRVVKNLFELKAGRRVTMRHATLSGCWTAGQVGIAIVITPKYGATIGPVLLEDLDVQEVSGVLNLLGYDYVSPSGQTHDVTMRRVTSAVSRARYGGDGRFALIGTEPAGLQIEACDHTGDGTSAIYAYRGDIKLADQTTRPGGPCPGFSLTRSRLSFGRYGLGTPLGLYATRWAEWFPEGVIRDNVLVGAEARTLANLPDNQAG